MDKSPTSRVPTELDVAKLAGVSQSAVSRAFTPGASIAEKTKKKILIVARELGYHQNKLARSLVTKRSGIIALAISYLENPFYSQVLKELSERLRETDRHILLFTTPEGNEPDPALEQALSYQVDALIMTGTKASKELTEQFRKVDVPIVQINRKSDFSGISTVRGEDHSAGRIVGEHLFQGGHKRFGFVSGNTGSSTSLVREEGFRDYLRSKGVNDLQVTYGNNTFEAAATAVRGLLSSNEPPDAIFCASDYMAFAALEVAKNEFGLDIPADLSVVGFNDVPDAGLSAYDLTTFSQPAASMVIEAIDLVDDLIANPAGPAQHRVVSGQLVVRGSSR